MHFAQPAWGHRAGAGNVSDNVSWVRCAAEGVVVLYALGSLCVGELQLKDRPELEDHTVALVIELFPLPHGACCVPRACYYPSTTLVLP